MECKIFLDTNILLDFFSRDRPSSEDSKEIWLKIHDSSFKVYLSESVLTTFDYIAGKTLDKKLRNKIILKLCTLAEVLSCNNQLVVRASQVNSKDFEDALLYEIAVENKLDYFITNDKSALKNLQSGLTKVVSSKEFLKIISVN